MTDLFDLTHGEAPLIVSIPHGGTLLPPGLAERLTPGARDLPDTDWHVPRLYDFVAELGATVIAARFSRYVVDLNRPPTGESLYPGQATTGLCPTTLFDGRPLYLPGREPGETEIADRVADYWRPYHDALRAELDRAVATHGFALLYDAHSIRSRVPRLFDGRLPDLNLGTAKGASCPSDLRKLLSAAIERAGAKGYTGVVDGRFVGGYITRHYGRPDERVVAVQMELAQEQYMDEDGPPFAYAPERADRLRPVLRDILDTFASWRPAGV